MADISIIIVNWNTRDLLLNCLESIHRETQRSGLEIIVVDNGSTDGSQDAVKDRFPDVMLIGNESNLGFSKANNVGIRASTGPYVCLVNSDIKALDGCVDRMREYMEQNPSIGALGPQTLNEQMQFRLNVRRFPSLWTSFCEASGLSGLFPRSALFGGRRLSDIRLDVPREVEVLSGCFLMVRRPAMEEVGLLDERFFIYGEDKDWCKRFWEKGWKVVFYPGARAIHYGGASSSAAPLKFVMEMLRSDFAYWEKHHTPASQAMFTAIKIFHYSTRLMGNELGRLAPGPEGKARRKNSRTYAACLSWIVRQRMFPSRAVG